MFGAVGARLKRPLLIGLATAIVPLQVGASTVAFPRASAAAFWVWLVSGGIVLASYAIDGGPWGTESDAVGLYLLGPIAVATAATRIEVAPTITPIGCRRKRASITYATKASIAYLVKNFTSGQMRVFVPEFVRFTAPLSAR